MSTDDMNPGNSPEDDGAEEAQDVSRPILILKATGLLVVWLIVGAALLVVLWLLVSIVLTLIGSL